MKVQRDIQHVNAANKRSRPRLNAAKREELAEIMSRLRFLLGTEPDKSAHTVQVVFTGEKHESVITIGG